MWIDYLLGAAVLVPFAAVLARGAFRLKRGGLGCSCPGNCPAAKGCSGAAGCRGSQKKGDGSR